jgi:hypothetical protein
VTATRAAVALGLLLPAALAGCRDDRATPDEIRAEIAALEAERDDLRARVDELTVRDPRAKGMPDEPVRVGVPTTLTRTLIEKLVSGFVDQVTLELANLRVRKAGTVRKIVTIGEYALDVRIDKVQGRLKTGRPDVRFGGNRIALSLPVTVASGTGKATIGFKWDGKNVSGAVCGDLDIEQVVTGSVRPARYPVSGAILLSAGAQEILATPRFPRIEVNLKVDPSRESWAAIRKVLDDRTGACGFVLDRVDVLQIVRGILDRGFDVRLPTEKIKPVAVPVGLQPDMRVKGQSVGLAIKVADLAITEDMIWLGARLKVDLPRSAVEALAAGGAKPPGPSPAPGTTR